MVLVNIDNPRWLDLTDRYDVTGIPQLNLFSADGTMRGRSLGARSEAELDSIANALMNGSPLPALAGVGGTSLLPETASTDSTGPRSHA